MSNELDVQIHVAECIPDFGGNCHLDPALQPRRPNVVSHRGHELTVNVRILSLPSDATEITLRAYVIARGPDRLGTEGFIFGAATLWGFNPGETFQVPSSMPPPYDFSIRVREPGADHLGQGPYEVIVNVEPGGGEPLAGAAEGGEAEAGEAEAGEAEAAATGTPAAVTNDGINIVEDSTFYLEFISL